jgi:hypothetical protein
MRLGGQTLSVDLAKAVEVNYTPPTKAELVSCTLLVSQAGKEIFRQAHSLTELGLIKNPGFETGLEGWVKNYNDPRRRVELDETVTREGWQALRVISTEPSDTGFYQGVMLKPGQWYRFSGWVRTRGFQPHGSSVYGTYAIQGGGGGHPFAKGANHEGDTEWTEVPITFQAPADGRVSIAVCFACWGQGTGTAWFDDLKLVEVSQPAP